MTGEDGEDQEPAREVYRTIEGGNRKTSVTPPLLLLLDSRKEGIQSFKVTAVPDTGCTASLLSAEPARDMNLIIRPTKSTLSDYRELNKLVKRPVHPFPSTKEILQAISATAKYFTKMYAVHGYFQLALDE